MNAQDTINLVAEKMGFTITASRDQSVVRYTLDGVTIRVTFGAAEGHTYGRPTTVKVLELNGYRNSEDGPWIYQWEQVGGFYDNNVYGVVRTQAIMGFIIDQMGDLYHWAEVRKLRRAS